jgi:hypothetical protein
MAPNPILEKIAKWCLNVVPHSFFLDSEISFRFHKEEVMWAHTLVLTPQGSRLLLIAPDTMKSPLLFGPALESAILLLLYSGTLLHFRLSGP